MKKFNQFNKDRPCFRNFDEAIKYDTTRRTYHYSLNVFMRFAGHDDYEDLAKMSTPEIQKLLKDWVISQKKKCLLANTISTNLNAVELFLDMNEISYHKKIVRKMLPNSDRITIKVSGGAFGPTGQVVLDVFASDVGLGSFDAGRFGFFNHSQESVRYSGFVDDPPPIIPITPVGGEFLSIDSTALLLAGLQTSAIWMLPVLAGAAGAGIAAFKLRRK